MIERETVAHGLEKANRSAESVERPKCMQMCAYNVCKRDGVGIVTRACTGDMFVLALRSLCWR